MSLEFKSRTGKVKESGNLTEFTRLIARRHAANSSDGAVFTFSRVNGASQPDKLVFWGTGAEIDNLLNQNAFTVKTAEVGNLRMEVRWLPITNKGGKKMAVAALKAFAKKTATVAGKAALGAVTHGGSVAVDVASTGKDLAKAAFNAVKGEIRIEPHNLDLDWELRIALSDGPGSGADGVVGWTDRSDNLGGENSSKQMMEKFRTLMGAYSVTVANAMLVLKGEQPYAALLDEADVEAALARERARAEHDGSALVKAAMAFVGDKMSRPSRDTYQRLDDEPD